MSALRTRERRIANIASTSRPANANSRSTPAPRPDEPAKPASRTSVEPHCLSARAPRDEVGASDRRRNARASILPRRDQGPDPLGAMARSERAVISRSFRDGRNAPLPRKQVFGALFRETAAYALPAASTISAQARASDKASWWLSGMPSSRQTSGNLVGKMDHVRRASCTVHRNVIAGDRHP